MVDVDPYARLRPPAPTPADEICACADSPPLLVRSTLGPNPVACASCNLEVPPERLNMPPNLVGSLASWRSFHDCFYLLWLDSAEFEGWARRELSDPASQVNLRGLAVRAELDRLRRAYLWWFQDVGADDFLPLARCPVCAAALHDVGLVGLVCDSCSVLVAN